MRGSSSVLQTLRNHWKDDRSKIFIAVSAGWFLSIGVRMIYPVLLPFFRSSYDLSLTLAGLLITVLWITYAFGQIPGGVLADRFGEGMTMAGSMLLAAATVIFIVTGRSVLILFVGTALLGFAIALFGTVRLTSLADTYPKRVGTVHGYLGAIGDIGNTLLPPLAGTIAAVTIWQFGLGFLIPGFVLTAIALWVFVPKRTSTSSNTSGAFTRENMRRIAAEIRHPSLVLGTVIMVFGVAIQQAFTGFYPTYLIEEKGMSEFIASGLFALFFALGIITRPVIGTVYDKIGVRQSLFSIISLSTIGFVSLPLVDGLLPLTAVTLLIAFMAGRGTVTMAYMTENLTPTVQNTGLGILRTFFFLGGAASPVIFGAIADQGYFDEAFLLLALLSGITLIVILRLPPINHQ